MITLEIEGTEFIGFQEATLSKSFDNASAEFTATISSTAPIENPIKVGDGVKVLVDGFIALTGFIDRVDGSFSPNDHTITVRGRDKTADLIDSTISEDISISTPTTLTKLAKQVISNIGSDIEVVSYIPDETFDIDDDLTAQTGESAFDFIEGYCRKLQVIATTDGLGRLVFTRASSTAKAAVMLINQKDGTQNKVLSGSFYIEHSQRFHKYTILSQGNAIGEINLDLDIASPADMASRSFTVVDNDIRGSRVFNKNSEKSANQDQCESECKWNTNIKRARSFAYTATVAGHVMSPQTDMWRTNVVVHVIDDFVDLPSEYLLISDLTFNYSLADGSTTDITCVTSDAFTLQPIKLKKTSVSSVTLEALAEYVKKEGVTA